MIKYNISLPIESKQSQSAGTDVWLVVKERKKANL